MRDDEARPAEWVFVPHPSIVSYTRLPIRIAPDVSKIAAVASRSTSLSGGNNQSWSRSPSSPSG
jgi:hypothetical protein